MSYDGRMSPIVALVAVAFAVVLFYFVTRGRKSGHAPEIDRHERALDEWILSDLAAVLRDKLPGGIDTKRVEKSLAGDPDPEVVSALEDVVQSVELEFLKDALDGAIDVVLKVKLEDGTERTQRSRRTLADLPARVREDFEKKALNRSRLVWGFPWARANEKRAFD